MIEPPAGSPAPRMQPQAQPLRTFGSLDDDLRRERRVFTTVIVLLLCATIAAAAAAVRARVLASLRSEEQIARLYDHTLANQILDRHSALTVASLFVGLHAQGVLANQPSPFARSCEAPHVQGADPLQAGCSEAATILSSTGDGPPLELIRVSDGATYVHRPRGETQTPPPAGATLVRDLLAQFEHARIDPVAAARDHRVLWFAASAIHRPSNAMVGAAIVTQGSTPYAIVLTELDLEKTYAASSPEGRELPPLQLDDEGRLLIGTRSRAQAERIDAQLANRADGVFHWIPSYGWALRSPPPLSGFGETLHLLPYRQQWATMRGELLLIAAVATALIVLLVSIYRYWNYRFLGRIYLHAYRALESEMLNHLLVHATPVGLCIVRRDALEILFANPVARQLLGLGPNDTRLPHALQREFDAHGAPAIAEPSDVEAEPAISQFSFAMTRAPDDDVYLDITYAPATLDRENVYFCAMTDITEHHRAEQMMREAQRTAEATARAKVAFFASMSHELRTPLASLVGNIELVSMGPLAPEQHERIRAMQSSAQGLLQIVNDVLDFSKIDVGKLTLFEEWGSLAALLDQIAMQHAPLALEKALRFYVVLDRKLPARLLFDPIRLAQIVNNLLSNAFKFTESGKIVLRAAWSGERVQITVTDSGSGIPDELRPHLFRPFTQASGSRLAQARGTGLGLSICARLAQMMNGAIELHSTVGVGTRVSVGLPLQASAADRQAAEWTLPWPRPALLCRAPEYHEWLTGLFDPAASTITTATDPTEALHAASHDFLIVTDEYPPDSVLAWWRNPRTIVWATQAGPLVPARRRDGGVEVSVFSLAGLRAATQSIADGRDDDTLQQESAASPPPAAAIAAAQERTPSQQAPARPLTVLIAEDNPLNRSLLRDQLTTLGAQVIEATRGDDALSLFDRQLVDAVFTDVNMPGLSGFDLLDRLHARRPSLPVFAISASALPEDVAEGRARGFADYLTKPVALAALANALETARAAQPAAPTSPPSGTPPDSTGDGAAKPDVPAIPPAFAQAFHDQTRADLSELADIVSARSLPRLRHWLHRVGGGLSMLGRSKLLDHCEQLRAQATHAHGWTTEIERHGRAIGEGLEAMLSLSGRHG